MKEFSLALHPRTTSLHQEPPVEKSEPPPASTSTSSWLNTHRPVYDHAISQMQADFDSHAQRLEAGAAAVFARSKAVDTLLIAAWDEVLSSESTLSRGVALLAVGGYGRQELFPYSDVDLMFLLDGSIAEKTVKNPIRRIHQLLWDAGLRVSAMTRSLAECEKFDAENVEFTLSLLDARPIAGDRALSDRLLTKTIPKLTQREAKKIVARLLDVTRTRHARYGDTLFHLEPNIKECPGGLRDAHVCAWLERLVPSPGNAVLDPDFTESRSFLLLARTFLHLRHIRDDNTLDWQAQDDAAAVSLGIGRTLERGAGAAYWMRAYFRHARARSNAASPARSTRRPLPLPRVSSCPA